MRLGFGVSGVHGTPLLAASQSEALIAQALERGVHSFDTAPAYGKGEAEHRLGRAIKRHGRDRFVLSTKAGLTSSGLNRRHRDFSPDAIEASVAASLSRLGVEGVDRLYLHGPDPTELTQGLIDRLQELKRSGAFVSLGVAGRGGELDAALETGWFEALMAPVHPFLDAQQEARLAAAKAQGLHLAAIETSGPGKPRVRAPRQFSDLYGSLRGLAAARSASSQGQRVSVPDGLKAALARPEVDLVMFTTSKSDHLRENLTFAAGVSGQA